MIQKEIKLSREFKKQTTKAILALSFFVVTYLIILILAVLLTGLCITAGITLIAFKPMLPTIALGIGLSSVGVLILIFLLKFIFKSHKLDCSHLVEIDKRQEPELFKMIEEIVSEVGTTFPKKVYLSSEVNASVFYDSNFWSMFLPVKKNLLIGLGLVNTVTKEEFKAILSHEFGHFSQKTMKVGSYVYNINQIIHNILFDNESYEELVQKWANVSGYFSIFVVIAGKINKGIQWILRKLYAVVNTNYMGLSREMEFHADEIAASVTGFAPLTKSLLRLSLADNSFNTALNLYYGKISENIKSENLYSDQTAIIHFLAEENQLAMTNYLPDISLDEQSKFDKSKLIIKDQWASHPTIEERVRRLENTGFLAKNSSSDLANSVFTDIAQLQKQITDKIFAEVSYQEESCAITTDKFIEEYKLNTRLNSFPKIYNGYYDNKNPINFDLKSHNSPQDEILFEELYSDKSVHLVCSAVALQNDIDVLTNISNNSLSIKTFDYDGIRHKRKDADKLIEKLKQELDGFNELIKLNDYKIYQFFKKEEERQNKTREIEQLYNEFFEFDKSFDSKYEIYTKLLDELQFTSVTTKFEQINANFNRIKPIEERMKKEINLLMTDPIIQTEITLEVKEKLEKYTSATLEYFGGVSYFEDNLGVLYNAIHNYGYLLSRKYFLMKRTLLAYQENLIKTP